MRPVAALDTESAGRKDRGRSHGGVSFRLLRHPSSTEMGGGGTQQGMRFSTLRMQSSAVASSSMYIDDAARRLR